MDTVFPRPVINLYYDQNAQVLWSTEGLGADDRAGIYAILKIISDGFKPSIIFTTDEEQGGVGACALAEKECPIPNLKYIIQLDRRGKDDCVFYDCANTEFITYIESFGFKTQTGSFSDISFLCPRWNVCGVNLSVGYENEHSYSEILNLQFLFNTIKKVKTMLSENNIPEFEYIEESPFKSVWYNHPQKSNKDSCYFCKKQFIEYELIPFKSKDKKTKFACADCFSVNPNIKLCNKCNEPYESDSKDFLCEDCKGE
jgi:hypothetical protein